MAWSSGQASGQDGERSAATATGRASFGSFLFTASQASSRTRAASLGCTPGTCSPAASSCQSGRCPARRRLPPPRPALARPSPTAAAASPDRPRLLPAPRQAAVHPRRPLPPCASPYAGPHRSSLPPRPAPSFTLRQMGTMAGMPYSGPVASHLFRATPRQGPAGRHVVRKPGRLSRPAADLRATPAGPLNATTSTVTPCSDSSIRRISSAASRSSRYGP